MNWFKRHLNWTLILAWLVGLPLWIAILIPLDAVYLYFLGVIAVIVVAGWNLKQKNRSLAHLLWFLLGGLGIIIILCLENRTGDRPTPEEA